MTCRIQELERSGRYGAGLVRLVVSATGAGTIDAVNMMATRHAEASSQ